LPLSATARAIAVLRVCGVGSQSNLLLRFFLLDGLRLLLSRFCSSWRSKGWREAYEAKKDQDRKQDVEKRLLPVEVHGPQELGLPATISRG
jgi:hypothetical protein